MIAQARRAKAGVISPGAREASDAVLVAAASAGDLDSFEVLVRRYTRIVLAIGRRMTGSSADAEDIAQQTFMKAFMNLSRFEGRCSFSTWLMTIASNEGRMWRRKRSRFRELSFLHAAPEEDQVGVPDFPDHRPDPETLFFRKERDALLTGSLRNMRPATRAALEICDLQERSTTSAALLLGISTAALKARRSRGRALLREELACRLSSEPVRLRGAKGHSGNAQPPVDSPMTFPAAS
jgi:RNA polymerase sigma-70 factor, ECF subfamily